MHSEETRVREVIHMLSNEEIRHDLRRYFSLHLSYKAQLDGSNKTINDIRATLPQEPEYQTLSHDQQTMVKLLLFFGEQERKARRLQFDVAKALLLLVEGLQERHVVFDEELDAFRKGTEKIIRDAQRLFMG